MSSSRHKTLHLSEFYQEPIIITIFLLTYYLPSPRALSFTYPNFSNTQDLNFTGDAFSYRGILSLTKDRANSSIGRVTYAKEFHLWDHATRRIANFSTEFSFNVTTYDQVSGGDGLALFISPYGAQIPDDSAGACLGLIGQCEDFKAQSKPVVAVEIDTYNNTWDPDDHHIGINVHSIKSTVNVSWPTSLKDGSIRKIRIDYDSNMKRLKVYMAPQSDPFYGQPMLSYDFDLTEILPEWVTVGFSGSTGIAMELHYIHSWDFQSNEIVEPVAPAPGPPPPGGHRRRQCVPWPVNCSGAGNWLLFVLFVIGLVVGAFIVTICFNVVYLAITGTPISWKTVLGTVSAMLGAIASCFGIWGGCQS